jgi:hypothetical protein
VVGLVKELRGEAESARKEEKSPPNLTGRGGEHTDRTEFCGKSTKESHF